MMRRPKLKDKVYGEMFWEEWDEDEAYWFAPIKNGSGRDFSLLIRADSPADFMTVGLTYSTYRKLLENLDSIRAKMVAEILENSRQLFKKPRHRDSAGKELQKNLQLFSIKIYSDLSSEVGFIGSVAEDEDPDETFYALLDPNGDLTEAGIEGL